MNQKPQEGEFGNLHWAVATDKVLPPNHVSSAAHPISAATSLSQCPLLLGAAGPFTSPPPPWSPLGSRVHAPLSSLRAPSEACLRTNPAIVSVKSMSWLLITSETNPKCSLPATKPSFLWPWPLLQPPPQGSLSPFSHHPPAFPCVPGHTVPQTSSCLLFQKTPHILQDAANPFDSRGFTGPLPLQRGR